MTARRFAAASLATCVTLAAGCARPGAAGGGGERNAWTIPGVLRLGADEEPDSLNLMYAHTAASDAIVGLIFSFLLRYDGEGNYVPDLATAVPTIANGGISRDGTRIVVHLRKGVVWADGAPLTAADWIFTYHAVRNKDNAIKTTYGWDAIASASAPDPYTIDIRLKRPNVEVLGILAMGGAGYPPMPAHLLGKLPNLNRAAFNEHPLSSGPYMLREWNHGTSLTFIPNPRYFRGPPKMKEVIWKVVPDVNTLFNELATHEVDVYPSVNANSIARLSQVSGISIVHRLSANWRHLGINLSRPQLADVRVRRAISEAVDWKRIEQDVFHSFDRLAVSDIYPNSWAAPALPPYRYDPSDARRLLAQAGWRMASDGVLHKGALAMHLTIYATTGHQENTQSQVLIQSMLRDVGIDVAVRNYPGSYLFAMDGPLYTGKYDLEWSVETNGPDPDNSGSWNAAFIPPRGANTSWLNDPIVNATSVAAAGTFDQTKRKALYQREEERIRELVPAVFFSWQSDYTAMNADLRNYIPAAFIGDTWNAWQWRI
ncbi:MAG: peptide ABC transporter substrate-binding protein [Candidatus Eremiobacteraeota bacterium]|nr:peptide ABC transporter substrate-binding protein [Candidatus Eremiobacteraeota bacterium]